MWRQQDAAARGAQRSKAGNQVGASWQHALEFDVQAGMPRLYRQEFRHPLFPGTGVPRRQKGRVDAG